MHDLHTLIITVNILMEIPQPICMFNLLQLTKLTGCTFFKDKLIMITASFCYNSLRLKMFLKLRMIQIGNRQI